VVHRYRYAFASSRVEVWKVALAAFRIRGAAIVMAKVHDAVAFIAIAWLVYGVLTPAGFMLRLFGRDALRLRPRDVPTY
jgi:hypothetical protein